MSDMKEKVARAISDQCWEKTEGAWLPSIASAMEMAGEIMEAMQPEPETWGEMGLRHSIERAEAVMALEAQGMTQTEAAKVLGMPLVNLNNFVKRNGLTWRVVRQGFASRDPESLSPYGVNNPPAGERMQ